MKSDNNGIIHKITTYTFSLIFFTLGSIFIAITHTAYPNNIMSGSPNTANVLDAYPFGSLFIPQCVASESGN